MSAPEWLEFVDLATSALIVVDMQNDFCHPQGAGGLNGRSDMSPYREIVPNIQRVIDAMHAAGRPVVWIKTTHDETTNSKVWLTRRRGRVHDTCTTGTWGTEYFAPLAPVAGDIEVIKHRYSAFIRTDLELRLRAMGVQTLLFTGVGTSGCVESTLRDGYMLDFNVLMVTDGTYGEKAAYDATMRTVSTSFGWLTDSHEISGLLDALPRPAADLVGTGVNLVGTGVTRQ